MMDSRATFLASLASVAGTANLLTAADDVEPFVNDWRGRYRGTALAVVRPKTTAEVAAIVRRCVEADIAIVTQGGNTGMVGGATPIAGRDQVIVSLSRMNAVRAVDAANATITVEAGVTLAATQAAATETAMRG